MDPVLPRERHRLRELGPRQRGRVRGHRQHAVPQHPRTGVQEHRRVNTAGEGHDRTGQLAEAVEGLGELPLVGLLGAHLLLTLNHGLGRHDRLDQAALAIQVDAGKQDAVAQPNRTVDHGPVHHHTPLQPGVWVHRDVFS